MAALALPLALYAQDGWFDGQAERVEPGSFTVTGGPLFVPPMKAMVSAVAVPPDDSELAELARGLLYDPVRIFNHVRDTIGYTPYFGLLKGAQQTLLERSGNDYDQAALLFRLLELSGFSPVFGYGVMTIPRNDAAAWLRTTVSTPAIESLLSNGGIPYSYSSSSFHINRVWVEVDIGGTVYKLDPAFKCYAENSGLDIRSTMGYSRSSLLTAAGGTVGVNSIQNLNQTALFTYLDGLAINLLEILGTTYHGASMDDILGASAILPEPVAELPVSLRFPVSGTGTWAAIPEADHHTVTVTHDGLDPVLLRTSDIAGRRLSVTYSKTPQSPQMVMMQEEEEEGLALALMNTVLDVDLPVPADPYGGIMPLAFYSYTFPEKVSGWLSYQVGMTWNDGNPLAFDYNIRWDSNPSGAFSLAQGGGIVYNHSGGMPITVVFSGVGQSPGVKNALLKISARRSGTSTWYDDDYAFSGTVAATPSLSVLGTTVATTYHQQAYSTNTFTIHNTGTLPLTLTTMTLSGGTPARFSLISGHTAGSIPAGGSRTVTWRYDSTTVGTHTTNVRFGLTYDGITYSPGDMILLQGQTLSVNFATLWLDDDILATESATPLSNTATLTLAIDHPYAATGGTYADQTVQYPLKRGATYAIVHGFGGSETGFPLDKRRRRAESYKAQGLSLTSREMQTESLNLMGQGWMEQTAMQEALLNRMAGVRDVTHHRFGLAAQEEGCYVDVKAQFSSAASAAGLLSESSAAFKAGGLLQSAMEHSIIEQTLSAGASAASTVKMLTLANAKGVKVHYADNNNFTAVAALLKGYPSSDLSALAAFTGNGGLAILPENGTLTNGQWVGRGYIGYGHEGGSSTVIQMIISGDYGTQHGGYSGDYTDWRDYLYMNTSFYSLFDEMAVPKTVSYDPVNLATGDLYFDSTDLTLGTSGVRGLTLARHYTSAANNRDGTLGRGWTHAYDIRLDDYTDYKAAFGLRAPRDAVPMLVAAAILPDLLSDTGGAADAKRWMCAALTTHWATEYATRNAVTVHLGDQSLVYVRRPGGGYEPPPGVTAQLTKSGNLHTLTERFGTKRDFNANKRLAKITDADGHTVTFTYNSLTNLTKVTGHYSRALNFTYSTTSPRRITRAYTSGDGTARNAYYAYDAKGNLTTYTDPEGSVWKYAYDTDGRLLTITDPANAVTASNRYDSVGRVMLQWNAHTNAWDFRYTGAETLETAPDGGTTTYRFDARRRETGREDPLGNTTALLRDGQDRVTRATDPLGNETVQHYDRFHNLTNRTDALGNEWRYAYDPQHRLTAATDPLGNTTTYAYDAAHRPTLTTDPLGNTSTFTYVASGNNKGLPLTATGPLGTTATYAYIATSGYRGGYPSTTTLKGAGLPTAGIVTETRAYTTATRNLPSTVKDAKGNTTTYTYNKRGQTLTVKDPLGNTTTLTYDTAGRPLTTKDPLNRVTSYAWTPSGNPRATLLPNGGVLTNAYDLADRPLWARDPRGTVSSNAYDIAGHVTETWAWRANVPVSRAAFAYDLAGNLLTSTDATGIETAHTYDALNRIVETKVAQTFLSAYSHDPLGNLTSTTDPLGKTRQWEYDPLGRKTAAIRPSGAVDSFVYNPLGNQTAYTNSEGNVYTMTYDALGRMTASTNALGQQMFRGYYDNVGNLTNKIDGRGESVRMTYDALNRLTGRTSPSETAAFTYDAVGNMLTANNATAQLTFTYDVMNRVTNAVTKVAAASLPPSITTRWQRDLGGLVTNLVYATGKNVSYTYNEDGNLTSVKDWLGNTWTFTYDAAGRLTGMSSPKVAQTFLSAFSYDNAGRLASYNIADIAGRTITYDAANRRIRDDITAGAIPKPTLQRTALNTFDVADKLVSASVRYGQGADSTPHITETFQYDGNGALTNWTGGRTSSSAAFTYDSLGRLLTDGEALACTYDALGNRLQTVGCCSITPEIWIPNHADPLKRPLMMYDAEEDEVYYYYIWGGNRLLGVIENGEFWDESDTLFVAHSDEIGSVIAFTDLSGNLLYSANYGPHGEDWGSTGYNPTPFAWLGGYGVQVLETDTPLKLYLTRHRVYSATLNRFLSSDPIGLQGGANLYAYGEGNPMAYIDPLGLCAEQSVWGAFWEGFGEGLKGGGSILANTFTFGYSDQWGWTSSYEYQGFEYDVSRFSASVARGALAGAGTAGLGSLAAGGSTAAQVGYGGVMLAGAYQGGTQIGYGIGNVIDGNYLTGAGQIAGGSLSVYGSYAGLNSMMNSQTTLYRAVTEAELQSIQNTGQFSLAPQSIEGKYFTSSAADASSYAKQAFYGLKAEPYTIISTKVPTRSLPLPIPVDGGGIPAYVLPESILPTLKPTILPSMPIPAR